MACIALLSGDLLILFRPSGGVDIDVLPATLLGLEPALGSENAIRARRATQLVERAVCDGTVGGWVIFVRMLSRASDAEVVTINAGLVWEGLICGYLNQFEKMLIAMVGRTFPVLVGRCRCKSIDRLSNRVAVLAVDDVISGGDDDGDRICAGDVVDVGMESDDPVVTGHHIKGDVSRRDHQVEHELVCAMIVYVVRTVGSSVLLLLGHDGMGLSGRYISGCMDRVFDTFHGWDDWGYIPTGVGSTQQGQGFLLAARGRRSSTCLGIRALWVIGKREAVMGFFWVLLRELERESVRFPAHGSVLIKRQAGARCSSYALRPE